MTISRPQEPHREVSAIEDIMRVIVTEGPQLCSVLAKKLDLGERTRNFYN